MRPNLVQTYINNMPVRTSDKKDRNLDIEYVLSNRTFIKPLKSRGHLVNNGVLEAPANAAKSFVYDIKSLNKSLKGKANDHELGKVNDLGMKVGGLALAAYLMTRKQTPLTKAMELVGFASFFGAMALWPKVALQLPAKLLHGVNIRQQYEDSFGRKKMFFQDPQYIPWDLVSDKKINRIGNWMGVPKDMQNRRDFIQEKMKKVAVQNNTLWMLTAGFATPIMSALACNVAEKPLKKYLGDLRSKKADKLIKDVHKYYPKFRDNKSVKDLELLYLMHKDQELTPELIKQIKQQMAVGFDGVTSTAIKQDLDNILLQKNRYLTPRLSLNIKDLVTANNYNGNASTVMENLNGLLEKYSAKEINSQAAAELEAVLTNGVKQEASSYIQGELKNLLTLDEAVYSVDGESVGKLVENIKYTLKKGGIPENKLSGIIPETKDFVELLKGKKYFGAEVPESELSKVQYFITGAIKKKIKDFNTANPANLVDENSIINLLINSDTEASAVSKSLRTKIGTKFTPDVMSKLRNIFEVLTDFRAKNAVLDEYIYLKAAAAPETVVANAWNEITEDLPALFKISSKEIEQTRYDRKMMSKLLREKFELITAKESPDYENVLSRLIEKINQLESKINILDTSNKGSYSSTVESVFSETANKLKEEKYGMKNTVERLIGSTENGTENIKGSLKNVQLSYVKNRLLGVRSSMYRLLNTLDFYRRISTLTNIPALHMGMPTEIKEELVELCKRMSIEGTTSDFITKFYQLRNPKPNLKEYGQITVDEATGKVLNRFFNRTMYNGKVDLPHDKQYFIEAIRLLFENEQHPQTQRLISESLFAQRFADYRRLFKEEIGSAFYFVKPNHVMPNITSKATPYKQFLRMGMAPDQMLHSTAKELFNTKSWLKMFGGFGLGLFGVTLLAQFFFGKMKVPERVKND